MPLTEAIEKITYTSLAISTSTCCVDLHRGLHEASPGTECLHFHGTHCRQFAGKAGTLFVIHSAASPVQPCKLISCSESFPNLLPSSDAAPQANPYACIAAGIRQKSHAREREGQRDTEIETGTELWGEIPGVNMTHGHAAESDRDRLTVVTWAIRCHERVNAGIVFCYKSLG